MRPPFELIFRVFHRSLLGCASLLVPGRQRAEWFREWQGELWQVCIARTPMAGFSWSGEREVVEFCLGAFPDALCLRRQNAQTIMQFSSLRGSALQCILVMAVMAVASFAIALLLPGVRAEHSLLPGQVRRGLIMIKDADCNDDSSPTISPRQYRTWKSRKQQYFDGLSFYRVTKEPVAAESHGSTQWEVGRASSNLFSLLGLTVQFAKADVKADDNTPRVILSEEAWKRRYNADPYIAGTIVRVGPHNVRIIGVVPDGSAGLPGKVDAWLLEPDSMIVSGYKGYVVARLTASGKSAMWASRIGITDRQSNHSEDDLLGFSLDEGIPDSKTVFLFAVFLAFLALPAMTSVSLGEYSVSSHRSSWFRSLYRPGFLGVKIALLLPVAYYVSLDMAYGYARIASTRSVYIQVAVSFTICLLGMRWALQDQRQRCPVCLRRVAHPAQVGLASRTFLAWNGTEMMCMGGHTLLHIPSLPTSWFSTQRWLYLDTSWEFLFAIKM